VPVFLWWALRNQQTSAWTPQLAIYVGIILAELVGAIAVRRRHQLPGLLPGLSAGLAGGLFIVGAVALYVMYF
jgi:hypothetical protein